MSRKRTGRPPTPPAASKPETFKEILDRAVAPFTAWGLLAATLTGALTSWNSLYSAYLDNPKAIVTLGFLLCSALLWLTIGATFRLQKQRRIATVLRIAAIALLGCLAFAILLSRPACLLGCGRSPHVLFGALATPAEAAESGLEVVDVYVDEARSTFRMTQNDLSIHATTDDRVRTGVEFD